MTPKTSLKIRTERAIAGYLYLTLSDADLIIYEGHTPPADESTLRLPALIVYAENAEHNDELPACVGVKNISLRCKFRFDSSDDGRAGLDAYREELERIMLDLPAIQSVVNRPTTGSDLRTIKGLHIHNITPSSDTSDLDGEDWAEEMAYTVTVEPLVD